MKSLIILFCPLLLGVCSCSNILNEEKEKEAIKAVIEEEKDAFFARDVARLGETWIQDSTALKLYFSVNGLSYLPGWSEVETDHKNGAESEMWDNVKDLKAEFSDYEFNFYKNTALVFCNTSWSGLYYGEELNLVQKRILHFIKINGKWKYDLMAMYNVPSEDIAKNKKTATIYHELNPENVDIILTEDFIGRTEKNMFTWDRENHRNYLTNGVYKRDSIFQQVAEGNWVATRFFREMDRQGKRIKVEGMHFKRFEDGKIAEIWEYGDSRQFETE